MDIEDKVAMITGGLGGIGFKTVQHMLKNSAKYVAILDLPEPTDERVTKCLIELRQDFGKGKFGYYQCDVTKIEDFNECYKKITETANYVHILINMAGTLNDKLVDLNIDVNYKAVVKCTLFAIDHMNIQKGGKGGVIVCIASTAGLQNLPFSPIYNASKHAVVSFVRSLKDHNKTLGLRIVCICPSFTDTNLMNVDAMQKNLLSFIETRNLPAEIAALHLQKPDNVAAAVIGIIRKGEAGAVWVTEDDQEPYGIKEINEKDELKFSL